MLSGRYLVRISSLAAPFTRTYSELRLKSATTSICKPSTSASFLTSAPQRAAMTEYKLKNANSLDLKNGEKQEFEVEGIENGKVLVCKINDKVHALSSNCTHYGAPLKLGVLTPSGRLTCAWHGACFNVSTGDVEDAPALDPLAKFELLQKNDGVYIKGDEQTIKSSRKQLNAKCAAQGTEKVVVVGGGSGSVGVIEGLRGGGFKGNITVISKEGYRPIDRTKLSKALLIDESNLAWRSPEFYQEASIEIVKDEVTGVNLANKSVTTGSGKKYNYTKLVLATGGAARSLPLPGLKKGELNNVFLLRSLQDAQNIVSALNDGGSDNPTGKNVVVIGSSFIGMEVANCIASMKKHNVTVVGMEETPLQHIMGDKIGAIFQSLLEKNGVKFYMGASVDKATPSDSDKSRVGAVHLKDGTKLPADIVIEGVGIAPATEFLEGFGKEQDGSLRTDERYLVQNLPNNQRNNDEIFAIGDIATYPYHGPGGNGKPIRIEHWNVAQNAGRSVAATINGKSSSPSSSSGSPKPFIPIFWSALGAQLRYCGNTVGGYDDIVINGEADAAGRIAAAKPGSDEAKPPSFAAYFANGEEIVAVATMMRDPVMTQAAELMRRGKMPTKSEIKGGLDLLKVGLPAEIKI